MVCSKQTLGACPRAGTEVPWMFLGGVGPAWWRALLVEVCLFLELQGLGLYWVLLCQRSVGLTQRDC